MSRHRAAVVLLVLTLPSCAGSATGLVATPPSLDLKGQSRCVVSASHAKPLIVEWPSGDRAALESQARRGVVPVRYEGCEMEVLAQCRAPGTYKYVGIERKEDHVTIRDADELYAYVPLGAAKLEARLAKAGELNVAMTIVGRYEAERGSLRPDELDGADCARATHVISGLTVGAFDFFAGATADAGTGATIPVIGANARGSSVRETLNRDGTEQSCTKATRKDAEPPEGCAALLRVEVVPLNRAVAAPVCASGTLWDGHQCARIQAGASLVCPAGMQAENGACVSAQRPPCPVGTHAEPGQGCLPDVPPARQAQTPTPASDADVNERARLAFQTGVRAFDLGKFEEARVAFSQAYALRRHPAVLLNLGLSEVKSGHSADGANHLQLFLRDPSARPDQRTAAEKAIGDAKKKAGFVVVAVDANGADVSVDGVALGPSPLLDPVFAAPGRHTFLATHQGRSSAIEVDVRVGKASVASIALGSTGVPATPR
jgi:hypothetical protein